eukprot:scaffold267609_cov31-Tisochrysis_lutea.AAC.1
MVGVTAPLAPPLCTRVGRALTVKNWRSRPGRPIRLFRGHCFMTRDSPRDTSARSGPATLSSGA